MKWHHLTKSFAKMSYGALVSQLQHRGAVASFADNHDDLVRKLLAIVG